MSNFSIIIEDAKKEINLLMDNPKDLPWYMSISQLCNIIKELETMNKVRDKSVFFPYYPKGIADCWDNNDELGKRLLEILDNYIKM